MSTIVRKVTTTKLKTYQKQVKERSLNWDEVPWKENELLQGPEDGEEEEDCPVSLNLVNNCSSPLWKKLLKLQRTRSKECCDVHVVAGDQGYVPCHRVFLMEKSTFLSALIKTNVKASQADLNIVTIVLPDVKLEHLRMAITLMYTGLCPLGDVRDEGEVKEVLKLLGADVKQRMKVGVEPLESGRRLKMVKGFRYEGVNAQEPDGDEEEEEEEEGGRTIDMPPEIRKVPPGTLTGMKRASSPRIQRNVEEAAEEDEEDEDDDEEEKQDTGTGTLAADLPPVIQKVPPGSLIPRVKQPRIRRSLPPPRSPPKTRRRGRAAAAPQKRRSLRIAEKWKGQEMETGYYGEQESGEEEEPEADGSLPPPEQPSFAEQNEGEEEEDAVGAEETPSEMETSTGAETEEIPLEMEGSTGAAEEEMPLETETPSAAQENQAESESSGAVETEGSARLSEEPAIAEQNEREDAVGEEENQGEAEMSTAVGSGEEMPLEMETPRAAEENQAEGEVPNGVGEEETQTEGGRSTAAEAEENQAEMPTTAESSYYDAETSLRDDEPETEPPASPHPPPTAESIVPPEDPMPPLPPVKVEGDDDVARMPIKRQLKFVGLKNVAVVMDNLTDKQVRIIRKNPELQSKIQESDLLDAGMKSVFRKPQPSQLPPPQIPVAPSSPPLSSSTGAKALDLNATSAWEKGAPTFTSTPVTRKRKAKRTAPPALDKERNAPKKLRQDEKDEGQTENFVSPATVSKKSSVVVDLKLPYSFKTALVGGGKKRIPGCSSSVVAQADGDDAGSTCSGISTWSTP